MYGHEKAKFWDLATQGQWWNILKTIWKTIRENSKWEVLFKFYRWYCDTFILIIWENGSMLCWWMKKPSQSRWGLWFNHSYSFTLEQILIIGTWVKSITQCSWALQNPRYWEILEIIVPSFYAATRAGGYSSRRTLSTRIGGRLVSCGKIGENPFPVLFRNKQQKSFQNFCLPFDSRATSLLGFCNLGS